jgi:hypothetical protein
VFEYAALMSLGFMLNLPHRKTSWVRCQPNRTSKKMPISHLLSESFYHQQMGNVSSTADQHAIEAGVPIKHTEISLRTSSSTSTNSKLASNSSIGKVCSKLKLK